MATPEQVNQLCAASIPRVTKICVIIAVHRQPQTLHWLLASLQRQDYTGPYEIFVCDDGSSGRVFETVEAWARSLPSIRYVWQPHAGMRLARSRNNGIHHTRDGDLLVFLDGDIIVKPDFLSRHCSNHDGSRRLVGAIRRWCNVDFGTMGLVTFDDVVAACESTGRDVDKFAQVNAATGSFPWMACGGFSFSVPRRTETMFDENIVGWGNDDWELFCRLYHIHDYRIDLREDIEVFHIVTPGESSTNPGLTNTHEHIQQYVANCIYMVNKFSGFGINRCMWPLTRFVFDEQTGRWRKADREEMNIDVLEAVRRAEKWLQHKL